MKNLLHLTCLLASLLASTTAFGQCSPNPLFANAGHGIYPYGPILMDCTGENANVTIVGLSETFALFLPVDTINIYMDAMRIDTVVGLPAGLSIDTDVMGSASAFSPYGEWLYTGSLPLFDPSFGCMNITGDPSAWAAASTGGPNNDGVFPLDIIMDYRVVHTDPDISFLIQNGAWFSTASGVASTDTFHVSLNVNGSACGATLFVSPEVTANTDTTQGCDGSVTAVVYGGQAPYSYAYSMGDSTQTVNDLCPGIYTVDVTDANGTTGTAQFAVGVEANVYSNVPPFGLPFPLDSLFGYYETCDLDYSLPIDSFFITQAFTLGTDTLIVEWVAYQLGEPYTLTSFYPYPGSNQTILSIVLFCANGRSEAGVFQLFDYIDLDATGIEEQTQQLNFSLMPNPTSGMLTLEMDEGIKHAQIDVFDPTGKLVMSQSMSVVGQKVMDLRQLSDGIYMLRLTSDKGFGTQRVFKMGGSPGN